MISQNIRRINIKSRVPIFGTRLPYSQSVPATSSCDTRTALQTYTLLVEYYAAQRTTVDAVPGHELRRDRIHAAREGDLGDVEFLLQQVVDNLDHPPQPSASPS